MNTAQPSPRATVAEWIAAVLLAGTAVAAPLALGSTGAWSRLTVEAAVTIAVVIWGFSAARGRLMTWLPVVLAAVLMLQLLPLPDGLLELVSPVAVGAWKVTLADSPRNWGRITVDPATTATAIRRLLLAAATVVVVADLGRHVALRRLLAGALCVVCGTIWTLGLAFPFDRNKLVVLGAFDLTGPIPAQFWRTPIEPPISTNGSGVLEWVTVGDRRYESAMWVAVDAFGPYIYANHFAAALTLTLPVLLGAWLAGTRRRLPNLARHAFAVVVFAGALWTAGILAASRAGAASLLLAALVFASLTLERLWARRLATVLCIAYAVFLMGFIVAFYGGFQDLEELVPEQFREGVAGLLADPRALAARTALRMFLAAPVLGSGLGTFGELFPRFLRSDGLLHYAHNDYAQWLAETGLIGAAFACGFGWMLVAAFRRWWLGVVARRQGDPLSAGLWAGLAGIGLHTAFDWNLHIPANMMLACVTAGLALAAGRRPANIEGPAVSLPQSFAAWLPGFALGTACLVAVGFLTRDATSDAVQRDMRKAIVAARLAAADPQAESAEMTLQAASARGERMFRLDSGNGSLAVLIGLARLHLAALPSHRDDAIEERAAADRWFAIARRHCATCRGLPEALPPPQPAPAIP
jgi:O-antigen ligase